MRLNQRIIVFCALLVFGLAPLNAHAIVKGNEPAYKQWQTLKTKFKSIKSFSADLFSWGYQTSHFIKNFPERLNKIPPDKKDSEPPPVPDWRYRIYHLVLLKPDYIQITYKKSLREDTERGSIINKAVALVLKHVPGTQLNYGWYKSWEYDDNGKKRRSHGLNEAAARGMMHPNLKSYPLKALNYNDTFIKFPMITDGKFSEIPVPLLYKAAMKIMMIASRREIYRKANDMLMDSRGFSVKDVSIDRIMTRYEPFWNTAKVTIEPAPKYVEADYLLNEKTGWLSIKNKTKPATIKKLVMVPLDVKKSRGITKVECFYDPATNVIQGLHEYENKLLVGVMIFQNMKVNDPSITPKMWEEFFKGRKISEQG